MIAPNSPHVLYLCSWEIGPRGQGAISFVYEQIDLLSQHVRASYMVPAFSSVLRWPGRVLRGQRVEPITHLWEDRTSACRIHIPKWPARLTGRRQLDEIWRAGPKLAKEVARHLGQVDLVHAHVVLPAGLFAASIAQELGVPLILQEHQAPFEKHVQTPEQESWVRRVLAAAHTVVAVGDDLKERMTPYFPTPKQPIVIPEMVRTELFSVAPRTDSGGKLRLISVGGLVERKGYHVLLPAVKRLLELGHDPYVCLVGEGNQRAALEKQAAELGIADRVRLPGHLPRTEVFAQLATSDVYVHASFRETFGIAPAEALAVGRPVVTTRCGGPESYVTPECGEVVAPGDAEQMAQAIGRVSQRLDMFDPEALHRRIDAYCGPAAFRSQMLSVYQAALCK